MSIEDFEEIEDLIGFNLSYGISIEDTLTEINQLALLDLFKMF